MPQTLLEMTKDLVTEQILQRHVKPENTQGMLEHAFATLQSLQQTEALMGAPPVPGMPQAIAAADWEKSISKHAIICLECGGSFRQLSTRHLRKHDLDARTYRQKYGIPSTQNLSSRTATARRRELAQQIRPWEQAASKRNPTKRGANP